MHTLDRIEPQVWPNPSMSLLLNLLLISLFWLVLGGDECGTSPFYWVISLSGMWNYSFETKCLFHYNLCWCSSILIKKQLEDKDLFHCVVTE